MLKLKLQNFGYLMRRVDSLEKALMLGGIGGRRRRGWQRMRWLDGITDFMDVEFEWTPGDDDGQGGWAGCDSWGHKESDTTERLNWMVSDAENLFMYLLAAWISSLQKCLMKFFIHIWMGWFCCCCWVLNVLYIAWMLIPHKIHDLQIISPIPRVTFLLCG